MGIEFSNMKKMLDIFERLENEDAYIPTPEEFKMVTDILVTNGKEGLKSAISLSFIVLYRLGYKEGTETILRAKNDQ